MLVHAQPAPRLGYLGNLLRCGLARPYSPRARPDGASGNGSISCSTSLLLRRLTGRLGPPGSWALLGSEIRRFRALTEAERQLAGCRRGLYQLLNAFRCLPCALGGDLARAAAARDRAPATGCTQQIGAIASSHGEPAFGSAAATPGGSKGAGLSGPLLSAGRTPRAGCRRARHLPQHSGSHRVCWRESEGEDRAAAE